MKHRVSFNTLAVVLLFYLSNLILVSGCTSCPEIYGDAEHYIAYHLDDVKAIKYKRLGEDKSYIPDEELAWQFEHYFYEVARRDPYYVKPEKALDPNKPIQSIGVQLAIPDYYIYLQGSDGCIYTLGIGAEQRFFQIGKYGGYGMIMHGVFYPRQHENLVNWIKKYLKIEEQKATEQASK